MNNRLINSRLISLMVLCAIFFINGCTTVPRKGTIPTGGESLKELCKKNNALWQWDSITQTVRLDYENRKASLLVDSQVAILDDQRIQLSMPVQFIKGSLIVPSDFKEKLINKGVVSASKKEIPRVFHYTFRKVKEVIIDPGHGGKDPGAIGRSGLQEKSVVLDIAKRLRYLLEKHGLRVKMTRDNDEFISLEERTEFASRSKADLFVSIHANSNPAKSVQGIEVYALRDLGFLEKNEAQRKENHRLLFNTLHMVKHQGDLENILEDLLYDYKTAESDALGSDLVSTTANDVDIKNLGLKHAGFYVLRNTLIPSILIEVGYLTNPKEGRLLGSSVYRKKLAHGIAKSILDYADIKEQDE